MKRIEVIDGLRAVASLSVALFHLCGTFSSPIPWTVARFGWLGVDVFFVISGFVIPYSLYLSQYDSVRRFPNFFLRRIIRLEPAYIVSVGLAIALAVASSLAPGFRGQPLHLEAGRVLAHLFYLVPLFSYDWFNPVYWSLAYEFCFYIVAGLSFPFLYARSPRWTLAFGCAVVAALYIATGAINHRIVEFVVGALIMRAFVGHAEPLIYVAALCGFMAITGEPKMAVAAAAPAIAIYQFRYVALPRLVLWFGTISYSLYLVHVPVGGRVINLATRLHLGPVGEIAAILLALAVSVLAAWVLYTLVEKPTLAIARGVRFRTFRRRSV